MVALRCKRRVFRVSTATLYAIALGMDDQGRGDVEEDRFDLHDDRTTAVDTLILAEAH